MRFFHLSDLHIGKYLHAYNLADLQKEVLNQIIEKVKIYMPDAILIAGDIYDKSVPSGEAVTIFDTFLNDLDNIKPKIPVLIIAGNHDSAERLNFASSFMEKHKIYLATMPPQREDEYIKKVTLNDAYGPVDFYLLPFLKPGYVRHLFKDSLITSYESAVEKIIERESIDYSRRNVLLSHQFYISGTINPETCESEQAYINVGGLDSVDTRVVEKFDYVALGHLHGSQSIGKDHIRYCGTPLKYSVSEVNHSKSITMITLEEKSSDISIEYIPLSTSKEVRKEKGLLADIIHRGTKENCHDFISVTITDELEPYNPKEQLEEVYDHILELRIDNARTQRIFQEADGEVLDLDPIKAFRSFYKEIQENTMTDLEEELLLKVVEKAREAE